MAAARCVTSRLWGLGWVARPPTSGISKKLSFGGAVMGRAARAPGTEAGLQTARRPPGPGWSPPKTARHPQVHLPEQAVCSLGRRRGEGPGREVPGCAALQGLEEGGGEPASGPLVSGIETGV